MRIYQKTRLQESSLVRISFTTIKKLGEKKKEEIVSIKIKSAAVSLLIPAADALASQQLHFGRFTTTPNTVVYRLRTTPKEVVDRVGTTPKEFLDRVGTTPNEVVDRIMPHDTYNRSLIS